MQRKYLRRIRSVSKKVALCLMTTMLTIPGVTRAEAASPAEDQREDSELSNLLTIGTMTVGTVAAAANLSTGLSLSVSSEKMQTQICFAESIQEEVKAEGIKAVEQLTEVSVVTDSVIAESNIYIANVSRYLSVFEEPTVDSKIIGRMYRGAACYVLDRKDGWSLISSGSVCGWVKDYYLTTGEEAKILTEKIEPQIATVTVDTLNIRKEADSSSDVIGRAVKGDQFVILDSTEEFWRVRVSSVDEGYICKEHAEAERGYAAAVSLEEEKDRKNTEEEISGAGEWVSLGIFRTTAYCACSVCNGASNAGKTATGVRPTAGTTIAVDTSVIPLGSRILVGDREYIAQDTGVFGAKIDIFHDSHHEAMDYGVKYLEAFIYRE